MDKNIPLPGSFYKDPDGNILQIICIAKNYKDKGMEVVYQKMSPPFDIWEEPLESFTGEIFNNKNWQKYMPCQAGTTGITANAGITEGNSIPAKEGIVTETEDACISSNVFREALLNGTIDRKIAGKIPDSEIAEKGFMEMLDARTYHEKYIIFTSLRKYLDKRLLNNIAVALDIVLEDGSEEEQYDSILHCLQTFEHYETQRLR
ncbi:MAG: hypothetical protein K1W24_00840 [Lachnospiraceae bacterium]